MLEVAVISFREGLEAFLIIAIMLAYVKNTGRSNLIKPIYFGAIAALFISATTAYHIASLAQQPEMEGVLALIAGVLVASLTFYVMKTSGQISSSLKNKIDEFNHGKDILAEIGIFGFTILMISREGMEVAMMIGALSATISLSSILTGLLFGLFLVAVIGYMWIKQSHKINLKLFMQVTGIFLILFSIQLFLYGFHELTETDLLPLPDQWVSNLHFYTEPLEPSEPIGQMILYSLVIVPLSWLGFYYIKDLVSSKK